MKKSNPVTPAKEPKIPLRKGLEIFKDIQLPWKLMSLSVVFTIATAIIALNTVGFSGEAVDAAGNVPMDKLIRYVVLSLASVACTAATVLFQQTAAEKINYSLRTKLWQKIIHTKQYVYEKDNGEGMVSRLTSDCDFASRYYTTVLSIITLLINTSIYLISLYGMNWKMANYTLS